LPTCRRTLSLSPKPLFWRRREGLGDEPA
jgi:hypothetical protein